ncbi:MAG: single-stranded DNA-binding protein [Treponema sp.]|nr:single-stranded DNA-binding protein [Treponema sp.]
MTLQKISAVLATECDALKFASPVAAVYNPFMYAAQPYKLYLKRWGAAPKKVIFLGMNPGPWGMAQTGVPFGEVSIVRDWLGIEAPVGKPPLEHPKRPIEGFGCTKSEVSGRRLWGLFRDQFGEPEKFFREHFVANYCPLVFMNASGANITPDKLPAGEAAPLFRICDRALADTITLLEPQWVIGIGGFAEKRIKIVQQCYFNDSGGGGKQKKSGKNPRHFSTARILHPSPANPKANTGWDSEVITTLAELGIWQG